MLNGLDSGMRALDGLPSPRFSFPHLGPGPARSSRLLGTGSVRGSWRARLAKAPVALIASSKSKLIDEFRRRGARK